MPIIPAQEHLPGRLSAQLAIVNSCREYLSAYRDSEVSSCVHTTGVFVIKSQQAPTPGRVALVRRVIQGADVGSRFPGGQWKTARQVPAGLPSAQAPRLVAVGKMGYVPLEELGATVLLQPVGMRHEPGSIAAISSPPRRTVVSGAASPTSGARAIASGNAAGPASPPATRFLNTARGTTGREPRHGQASTR